MDLASHTWQMHLAPKEHSNNASARAAFTAWLESGQRPISVRGYIQYRLIGK